MSLGRSTTLDVEVPPGCVSGDTVDVTDPEGTLHSVVVPDGREEGETFEVIVYSLAASHADIMSRFEAWFEREGVDDKMDEFCQRNAARLHFTRGELAEESTEGEQSHDWWPAYLDYQRECETLLEQFVDEAGCTAEDFLEAAKYGGQGMGQTYMNWLLALSEYENFVQLMKDQERAIR
jgi:hypothetical protein